MTLEKLRASQTKHLVIWAGVLQASISIICQPSLPFHPPAEPSSSHNIHTRCSGCAARAAAFAVTLGDAPCPCCSTSLLPLGERCCSQWLPYLASAVCRHIVEATCGCLLHQPVSHPSLAHSWECLLATIAPSQLLQLPPSLLPPLLRIQAPALLHDALQLQLRQCFWLPQVNLFQSVLVTLLLPRWLLLPVALLLLLPVALLLRVVVCLWLQLTSSTEQRAALSAIALHTHCRMQPRQHRDVFLALLTTVLATMPVKTAARLHTHLRLGQAPADGAGLLGPQVQGQVRLTGGKGDKV